MNNFKKLLVAIVFSSAAFGAAAASYDLGSLKSGSNLFGLYTVGPGTFSDQIRFHLTDASDAWVSANSFVTNFGNPSNPYYDIFNMNVSLHDSFGSAWTYDNVYEFNVNNLSAGDYWLEVNGYGAGSAGGVYGGAVLITPSVPEPSELMTFLAGLGVLGMIAYRRRKQ